MKLEPIAKRFWRKVDRMGKKDCWIFRATVSACGYGLFSKNGSSALAHRVSWWIHYGEIPKRKLVLHKCDNPPCVNPNHLFIGTPKDNAIDRAKKGRSNHPIGGRNGREILSESDVKAMRQSNLSCYKLADIYLISKSTAHAAISRKTWSHI